MSHNRSPAGSVLKDISPKLEAPPDREDQTKASLYSLLQTDLPPLPEFYRTDSKVLHSTKGITEDWLAESSMLQARGLKTLRNLIYAPDMFNKLLLEAQALLQRETLHVQWSNGTSRDFVTQVLPWYTRRNLPTITFSERDIEHYLLSCICRPALSVCKAVEHGIFKEEMGVPQFPTLSSCIQSKEVIPDIMLVAGGQYPNFTVPVVIEAKSEQVLSPPSKATQNEAGPANIQEKNVLQQIQSKYVPKGFVMKFKWPETRRNVDNLTRVLAQVWKEISTCRRPAGDSKSPALLMLSTYTTTTFFVHTPDRPDTLYMSNTVNIEDRNVVLMTYCMFASALGQLQSKFELPTPNDEWANSVDLGNEHASEWSGLNPRTLPERYEGANGAGNPNAPTERPKRRTKPKSMAARQ